MLVVAVGKRERNAVYRPADVLEKGGEWLPGLRLELAEIWEG